MIVVYFTTARPPRGGVHQRKMLLTRKRPKKNSEFVSSINASTERNVAHRLLSNLLFDTKNKKSFFDQHPNSVGHGLKFDEIGKANYFFFLYLSSNPIAVHRRREKRRALMFG